MAWHGTWFLIAFSCIASPLLGWEPPPQITLKGILKTATQKSITKHPDDTEEHHEKTSTVLVPEEPITFSRSITIGTKPPLVQQETAEFVHLFMPEEFDSLLGGEVELHGHFVEPSTRFYFISDIQFDVDTVIDTKQQKKHPAPIVFYGPHLTELKGTLYQKTYPGPPEYYSIEHGDIPESPLFLTLTEPVDVLLAEPEEDPLNQPEIGVREIQIVFSKDDPPEDLWSKGITVKGTLFSAHTGHHRRRVLMMAHSWKPIDLKATRQEKKMTGHDIPVLNNKNRFSCEQRSHAADIHKQPQESGISQGGALNLDQALPTPKQPNKNQVERRAPQRRFVGRGGVQADLKLVAADAERSGSLKWNRYIPVGKTS